MPVKLTKHNDIKVFILYLMDRMGYPLDFDDITAIMIQDNITNYFDFAHCFAELEDAGHVEKLPQDEDEPRPKYCVSESGRTISDGLNSILARSIKDRAYRSALRHMSLVKRGAVVDQTIRLDGEGVLFKGTIKDPKGLQLEVSIRTDNDYQLRRMQEVFDDRPEIVLQGITAILTGDLDFVFGNQGGE